MPEDEKGFRDLSLNDEVTVKVPVHIAYGFAMEYMLGSQKTYNAQHMFSEVMRQLFDPGVLAASEAEQTVKAAKQAAMNEKIETLFLGGQGIAFPFNFPGSETE